ncbi:MAG TPA: hypothetical protein VE398_26480 [Acidobacteriota bacterium]|nr:hypothetical protein [Acidobacteriota bacterium]
MDIENVNAHSEPPFKKCGSCGKEWPHWKDFVLDGALRLLGLQAYPDLPDANLIVFEHRCGTSVSVLATRLRPMLQDPEEGSQLPLLYGTESCNGRCRHLEDLQSCDRACINARDRRLMLQLLEMRRSKR